MKNILLSGCNGAMGKAISLCLQKREDCRIVAGVDYNTASPYGYPVFSTPKEVDANFDVCVDFSHPSLFNDITQLVLEKKKPLVMATTGLSLEQLEQLEGIAAWIPVFRSANMSLGINLMVELAKRAASVLSSSFDIEIIEKHHNQKIDAPSGTALMLADGINQVLDSPLEYQYDRHLQRQKRSPHEIGIHSIRGGTIVGEHEVLFAGHDEVLTVSHAAYSKDVFADGAIQAALFLCEQKPGFYDMSAILRNIL